MKKTTQHRAIKFREGVLTVYGEQPIAKGDVYWSWTLPHVGRLHSPLPPLQMERATSRAEMLIAAFHDARRIIWSCWHGAMMSLEQPARVRLEASGHRLMEKAAGLAAQELHKLTESMEQTPEALRSGKKYEERRARLDQLQTVVRGREIYQAHTKY